MKSYPSKIALGLLFLLPLAPAIAADEPSDPSWRKAADNHIFAQQLVNDELSKSPDLIVIGVHADLPGTKDERMIASNLDRIGKRDDDDDKAGAIDGKTVLAPNLTEPGKFEILIPMLDKSGDIIGAIGLVFKYQKGDSQLALLKRATEIRDEFAQQLDSAADLFRPIGQS